jgi:membrane-bound serine protease (ClpP class)
MAAKAMEDAVAYIRSLAEMRDRNADWAESAVRKAASLSSQEALKQKVIDLVARDEADLLRQANGREVTLRGETVKLQLDDVALREIVPDWRNELLATITNPNVAFILMMIGIYGIIFEFINPGSFIPGTVGAIALLVAFYALNILPINYAGLALVLLGIALLVAEAFLPTFGIVGFGGIAALVLGATMLIDTDVPGFAIAWPVIVTTAAASAGFLLLVAGFALHAQRRPVVTGREQMIGSRGKVLSWSDRSGRVFVQGENWQAVSDAPLAVGQFVTVRDLRSLTLVVTPDNT